MTIGRSNASTQTAAPPGTCLIRGGQVVTARRNEIAALARQPTPAGGPMLPTRFLRHADEQTVVGIWAVLFTLSKLTDHGDRSGDAVVAASCRAGQPTAARTMVALEQQGPVGVTPHVVPQCSLHSPASAVSVGLGMHGPTIGVGGGPAASAEGLLAATGLAMSLAVTPKPPAIWLVCTSWDNSPQLDDQAAPTNDPVCRGLALWLEPLASGSQSPVEGARLQIDAGGPAEPANGLPLWEFSERLTQGRACGISCGHSLTARLLPGPAGFGVGGPAVTREAA